MAQTDNLSLINKAIIAEQEARTNAQQHNNDVDVLTPAGAEAVSKASEAERIKNAQAWLNKNNVGGMGAIKDNTPAPTKKTR